MKNSLFKIFILILTFSFIFTACKPDIENEKETINSTVPTETSMPTPELTPEPTLEPTPEPTPSESGIRDERLEGRGNSDSGRSEPQYVGYIGYIVSDRFISISENEKFNTDWHVPVYEKDKQFYNEVGTVEHKTEVLVLSQELSHEGFGRYSGYLEVKSLNDDTTYLIDVNNFITKPYWTYSIDAAVSEGPFIAEYNQISDYYPVDNANEKVELSDGFTVIVTGRTGTYGKGGPDKDTNQVEAIVYKEWKNGYGGISVFFNYDDLKIIY